VFIIYPGFDWVTAIDVVIGKYDKSCVGTHHQQTSNPKSIPPEGSKENFGDFYVALSLMTLFVSQYRRSLL
jgi:hypothetical protein